MGLFRSRTRMMDAEHLLEEVENGKSAPVDPAAPVEAAADDASEGAPSADFRLTVEDVFVIRGRGTVVTGRVETGSVSVGSVVALSRNAGIVRRVKVTGVEMFRKTLDTAVAGQNVGLLLDQVSREDVEAGDVLTA